MTAAIQQRLTALNDVMSLLSTRDRMVLNTSDALRPAYLTTHFDKPYAGVQIATQCGGTTIGFHRHDAQEWFFVLKGRIAVEHGTVDEVGAGEQICIPATVEHRTLALEDSQYVVITMPNLLDEVSRT